MWSKIGHMDILEIKHALEKYKMSKSNFNMQNCHFTVYYSKIVDSFRGLNLKQSAQ